MLCVSLLSLASLVLPYGLYGDTVSGPISSWSEQSGEGLLEELLDVLRTNTELLEEAEQVILSLTSRLTETENRLAETERRLSELDALLSEYADRLTRTERSRNAWRTYSIVISAVAVVLGVVVIAQ